jgi:hypothetical protein
MTSPPVDVAARRWEHGWELHVSDGRGSLVVLPARRLSAADRTVRDYVAFRDGVDPQSVQVRITVAFGTALDDEIAAVRAALEGAERTQREAAARSRGLALRLREAGLSGAEIAVVLQVSPQRVSQLMRTTGC